MLEYLTEEIIQSTFDNSAGTLLNRNAIDIVINLLIENRDLSRNNVDKLIANYSTDCGYMVQYSDFNYVLKDHIIGDNLQQDIDFGESEKDLEIVELMYGEWHSECGDR